jgi:putative transferase (TIGR04331 family)
MKQKKYFLVTTADERTWKFDRPVLFLGEWCRLYDRKHIWQNMDAIVAAPYGLGQAKKDVDHVEARALEEQLFPILCEVLNRHHGTRHSSRFWQIVLGHWFRRFVDAMLNRVRTLEQCLQTNQVSGTMGFTESGYTMTPMDSHAAILAFNNDRWNNELNIRILKKINYLDFSIETMTGCCETAFRKKKLTQSTTIKQKILNLSYFIGNKITHKLVRTTDAIIINSYLPKLQEIKLQLVLNQCPQLWNSPTFEITHLPDSQLRKRLTDEINVDSGYLMRDVLYSMLFQLLPVCYLESFDKIREIAKQQPWPEKPKFIFTSNNFDTDEVFKVWTAKKMEMGFNYIVGQHGNYGVSRNHLQPSIEEITADKFITWGWTDGLQQHIPAFLFKNLGRKKKNYDSKGGLLLIELAINHRITTFDGTYEFAEYFKDQINFVSNLSIEQRQQLTIRLHSDYGHMRWGEEARWNDLEYKVKIEKGIINIRKLISNSKLVIHSYDSTGILDTLEANIPTLAFWQNNFDHLRESAKPFYDLLLNAGIVHLSVKSVTEKINSIWEDIDGWWFGSEIQEARAIFCERYAKSSEESINKIKNILTNEKLIAE